MRETTGTTAAVVQIVNGSTSTGVIAVDVSLAAGESVRERWAEDELVLDIGCYVNVVSGTIEGSIGLRSIAGDTYEEHEPRFVALPGSTVVALDEG